MWQTAQRLMQDRSSFDTCIRKARRSGQRAYLVVVDSDVDLGDLWSGVCRAVAVHLIIDGDLSQSADVCSCLDVRLLGALLQTGVTLSMPSYPSLCTCHDCPPLSCNTQKSGGVRCKLTLKMVDPLGFLTVTTVTLHTSQKTPRLNGAM